MNILIYGSDETPLARAVAISLFTWRRALPSDKVDDEQRNGWWGDTYPSIQSDRIGSRLWLLRRSKITRETLIQAEQYAREALQWLIDDKIVSKFDVLIERDKDAVRVNMKVTLWVKDSLASELEFNDMWRIINAVQVTNLTRVN